MKSAEILYKAADLVSGDRNETHGDARENFDRIAALWGAWLNNKKDDILDAHDVAIMMMMLKAARTVGGAFNADDYVDMAGYAALAATVTNEA